MKKLTKKALSIVLTLTMVSSLTTVAATSVSADAEANLTTLTEEKGGTYTLDDIYTEYLYSHTDKSSEKPQDSSAIKNEVANANSDDVYAAFKFSQVSPSDQTTSGTTKTMEDKAEEILNDTSTDNPLSGYSFARPMELLIGQINRNKQHEGEIRAIDNVSSPINELGNIDNLANAGATITLTETKEGQTHNTIGIDFNGDNVDELAYFSLYADSKGHASVRTYRRSGSGSSLSWELASDQNMKISDNDKILDIEAQQSKGYTAMTAGDFDADGKEELACYFPCANNGDGISEPFVGIIDISDDGNFSLGSMKKINLSSIRSGLNDLKSGKDNYEDWYMPVVALSTTSIRANGATDGKKSHDDLVINVSIPRVYHDDDANMNSCIAIYSYNNGSYDKKFSKDLRFDSDRMISTNAVDADLNGDGYNELVVAGLYEYSVSSDYSTNKISTDKNLVQLISWDGSSYRLIWDSPKKVTALGNIKVDWDAQEPIAITAGRYNPNTVNTLDYLCVQGVVLSCNNTKIYGIEKAAAKDTQAHKAVIDTVPNKEIDAGLFKDAEFNTEYTPDIYNWCEAHDNAYVSAASSGLFYVNGKTDTIALLTGDEMKSNYDHISYDIVLLSCDSNGNWQHKAYDEYMHDQDEDDYGTFMSMCFVDCDEDQFYYRYKGKTVGYSSPTLFSVVQVPPFYKENNSASVSYTITHSNATGWTGNWGVGLGGGVSVETKKLEVEVQLVAEYVGSCSDTTTYERSTTLTLYTDTDYAVSMVVPLIVCTYDVWIPYGNNGDGELTEMSTAQQLEPAFAALPLDEYNALAASLTDEEQRAAAPEVDKIPSSSAGDPYGYIDNMDDLTTAISGQVIDSSEISDTGLRVGTDTESKTNSISVTKTHDEEHGLNVTFDASIKIGIGKGAFTAGGGFTHVTSDSDGVSFDVTYNAIASKNTAPIDPDSSSSYEKYKDYNGNPLQSSIVHYQPADYTYHPQAVAYPSDKLTNDVDQSEFEYKRNKVYILSFCAYDFGGNPPELPEYFGAQSVEENDDGTYSVTLAWRNQQRNKKRRPSGNYSQAYNIYVKSLNADTVELVNKEGPIFSDTENDFIMTYKVENLKNPSKDYVFYIAAAKVNMTTGVNNSKVVNVFESILSKPVTVNIDNLLNTDGVIITKQPENFYATHIGVEATFSVDAVDSKGETDKLYYHWQTYNSGTEEWEDVTNDKSSDPKTYVFDTTQDSVGKPVRCRVTKNSSIAENYTATSNVVTVTLKHTHKYNDNGFCTICDQYQPATLNSNGVYEIANAGNFFWFASLVNGEKVHADFDEQNASAKGVLVSDIDLEGREWSPIRDYTGVFDGQNHTISGLKITETPHDTGLFRSVYGTIKNFTVKGDMIISANGDYIGGVVGYADGSTISNVASYVNISNTSGVLKHVGGVVGYIANKNTYVDKCVYYGTINVKDSLDCIGGIVGYSNAGARISNCANHGTVSASKTGAYTGGILGYVNNTNPTVKDCYNYGKVSNGGNTTYCGAIIGWTRNYTTANISNNYYLDSSTTLAFGSGGKSGATATAKTAEQFKSGEVAYLLNHSVTDGTQVWYQNIDNGKTPDDYPVFEGGTVYYLEYKNGYSNFYSEKDEDEFEKDEDGNFLIKTYDDLVTLSNVVRSEYDKYGSADYVLANSIFAPQGSKWTQGIGSVKDNKPFNGTFSANGYCIVGLRVACAEYGGLFEIIGESGNVSNLFVFDCDFEKPSDPNNYCAVAGGIAAVNNGTIDHCKSGVNITSGTIDVNDEVSIYAPSLNSDLIGKLCGGIAGENNGVITGCQNASIVTGDVCGGIAGLNAGTVYGCANNGSIGDDNSSVSGGLAGKNTDKIDSSYTTGVVKSKSLNARGSVAGLNIYISSAPSVTNVSYSTASKLNAVGTDSTYIPDNSNTAKSTYDEFKTDEFVNYLNKLTEGSVKWKDVSTLNKGWPLILNTCLMLMTKDAGNDITVQGVMHKDLNISYKKFSDNSQEFALLAVAIGDRKIQKSYAVSLSDNNGNYIPAELWCQSDCTITLPVDSKNIQLVAINTEGDVTYYEPDTVENGKAVFTVSHPMSFAIVEKSSGTIADDDTPIKTGVTMGGTALLAVLISFGVILITKRRNKIG
ncbi:MAG: hypothetical protein ACI4IS_01330 [Acutalibacteraceae bacterium]